ncbi:hypothetical protein MRB53_037783 [Persea americana]|nr:hypothetical protein MRB53_037783 [Persea americana]
MPAQNSMMPQQSGMPAQNSMMQPFATQQTQPNQAQPGFQQQSIMSPPIRHDKSSILALYNMQPPMQQPLQTLQENVVMSQQAQSNTQPSYATTNNPFALPPQAQQQPSASIAGHVSQASVDFQGFNRDGRHSPDAFAGLSSRIVGLASRLEQALLYHQTLDDQRRQDHGYHQDLAGSSMGMDLHPYQDFKGGCHASFREVISMVLLFVYSHVLKSLNSSLHSEQDDATAEVQQLFL